MSDPFANESSSFSNNLLPNNVTSRPKYQPIRVKPLLHFCESDDEESESKGQDSDAESDVDDFQPLAQDDSTDDVFVAEQETSSSQSEQSQQQNECNEVKKTCHDLMSNISSRTQNLQESKLNNIVLDSSMPPYNDSNHIKGHKNGTGDIKQELSKGSTPRSGSWPLSNMDSNSQIKKVQVGVSSYDTKRCYQSEKCSTTELLKDRQSCEENIYRQERNNHKDNEAKHMLRVESKETMKTAQENHKSAQTSHEQGHCIDIQNKDQGNICQVSQPSNIEHEPAPVASRSCSNAQHSSVHSFQNHNNKYETVKANTYSNVEQSHVESSLFSSMALQCDGGSATEKNDHFVNQTPLKHLPLNCARPNPCYSRRNITQTPQSKMNPDLSKSHGQTPATMLSHKSQTMGRTPLQTRSISLIDSLQTPKTSSIITSSASMHDTPRYFADGKTVRRPLADATGFAQNDIPMYPLDSKPRLLQSSQASKMEEITPNPQNKFPNGKDNIVNRSSTVKRALEISKTAEVKSEPQVKEVTKENRHPNTEDASDKEKQLPTEVAESNSASHLNTFPNSKNSSLQTQERDAKESNSSCKESQAPHISVNTQNKPVEMRDMINNATNVQFSVLSNVSKTKQNNILTVKGRDYLVLNTLGKGMSGEVVRVQDLSTFELCAIKCVNLSRMEKDSAQGCLEEISMLHKLQAPCIVKMYNYEIKYPMVYVVMEMGDTDLSRLLKSMLQEKQLPLTMILYYWTEMLTAVKHIHDNGVIHSDLKPANFLLVRGRLKLIDFGIASSMNADMTSVVKNCLMGTLNYISPEALMDIGGNSDSPNHNMKYKISFKSDVWSLGCILYSLVYGHTPFHHIRQQWAKMNAITNPHPNISFPATLSAGDNTSNSSTYAPPVLIDVMRKCLQHDPKARPTVAQLLQVQYIPTKVERPVGPVVDLPGQMLIQAKHALNETEWRQLTQLLEKVRFSSLC